MIFKLCLLALAFILSTTKSFSQGAQKFYTGGGGSASGGENRFERQNRENDVKRESEKRSKDVILGYCEVVTENDKARKQIAKDLGWDPDKLGPDRLKSQDFISGVCAGIAEKEKEAKQVRENYERNIAADRERSYKDGWNLEKESNNPKTEKNYIPLNTLMFVFPTEGKSTDLGGESIVHFFTLDKNKNFIYILEPKRPLPGPPTGFIKTDFETHIGLFFLAKYKWANLIYKNEFKYCFNNFPKDMNQDGVLTVRLKPGNYLVFSKSIESDSIYSSRLKILPNTETNFLIHIRNDPKSMRSDSTVINQSNKPSTNELPKNLIKPETTEIVDFNDYYYQDGKSVKRLTHILEVSKSNTNMIYQGNPGMKTVEIILLDFEKYTKGSLYITYFDGAFDTDKITLEITKKTTLITGSAIEIFSKEEKLIPISYTFVEEPK